MDSAHSPDSAKIDSQSGSGDRPSEIIHDGVHLDWTPQVRAEKTRRLPRWLNWGLLVLVVILLGSLAVYGLVRWQYQGIFVTTNRPAVPAAEVRPDPTPPPPPVHTFALLGYGGAGHDGGRLTDSIMVVRADEGTGQIALISVPRDSRVSLPSHGSGQERFWKVNAAYAIGSDDRSYPGKPAEFTGPGGGGSLAMHALEQVVGFPIEYFVAIDFNGFRQVIDQLGGLPIYIDRSFTDPYYPIAGLEDDLCEKSEEEVEELTATLSGELLLHEFNCRFEELSFTRGQTVLDGETALKYVRSRHAGVDGGDFNRARRQRNLLLAVRDRVLSLGFISKIPQVVTSLTSHMQTNLPLDELGNYLARYQEFNDYQIVPIALTSDEDNTLKIGVSRDGQSIVLPASSTDPSQPDWQSVHEFIEDELERALVEEAEMSATDAARPKEN